MFDLFIEDGSHTTDYLNCEGNDVKHAEQEHLFLALSTDAVGGTEGPRSMRLMGSIQNRPMSILIDSGSSHTFISQRLADQLEGVVPLPNAVKVQVANGSLL
jgi:hypothetical protein